jgi:ribosomal protein S19E (S16A)
MITINTTVWFYYLKSETSFYKAIKWTKEITQTILDKLEAKGIIEKIPNSVIIS